MTGRAELPPDKDAMGLVAAIRQLTQYEPGEKWIALANRLGNIGVLSSSLAVLLAERDAEREEKDKAVEVALLVLDKAIGGLRGVQDMQTTPLPSIAALIEEAETALARVKGGS